MKSVPASMMRVQRPIAPGHRGNVQAVLLALFEELLQAGGVHMLMAALIHGFARRLVIDNDPLPNSRTEAASWLGAAAAGMVGAACAFAQPNALHYCCVCKLTQAC